MDFGTVNRRKLNIFVLSAYLVSGLLLFWSSLNNFFVSDDFILLSQISQSNFYVLFWHYPPDFPHFFRPLAVLIYKVLFLMFGYSQNYFLYFNLLLHILNSFFVFLLTGKILSINKNNSAGLKLSVSFFSGLLFLMHYIHSEPVLFMAAMSELLFSFFYLLALIFYFRYKESSKKTDKFMVILFFVLCLFSKETGISLIVLLFFAEKILFKSSYTSTLKSHTVIFVIGIVYIISRFLFFPRMLEPRLYFMNNIWFETAKNIIFTFTALFYSLDFMAIKDFLKSQQDSLFYSVIKTFTRFPNVVIALVSAVFFYFIMLYKKDKIPVFSFFFILTAVLPTLWLAVFERYLYLPSAGFSIMTVYFLFILFDYKKFGKPLAITLLFLILLYNGFSLINKNRNWNIAAEKSENIVKQLQDMSAELPSGYTVYFKRLPDNYNGAWVFRNGIDFIPSLYLGRNDIVFKRVDDDEEVGTDYTKKTLLIIYINGKLAAVN